MNPPQSRDEFLEVLQRSRILSTAEFESLAAEMLVHQAVDSASHCAQWLCARQHLSPFQAEQLLLGRWRHLRLGRYVVVDRLGAGGMSCVFLARDELLKRKVALKVLPTETAQMPGAKERLEREANVLAMLDHPNIIRAFDLDACDEVTFLTMEYVKGENLRERVARAGPLSIAGSARIGIQTAAALQYAFDQGGLVHGDIKPSNLLLDGHELVRILDFGLTCFRNEPAFAAGPLSYRAPERCQDGWVADIRADIFSLGITLVYALSGQTANRDAFAGSQWSDYLHVIRSDVPREFLLVVEKMTATNVDERPSTGIEVVEALFLFANP